MLRTREGNLGAHGGVRGRRQGLVDLDDAGSELIALAVGDVRARLERLAAVFVEQCRREVAAHELARDPAGAADIRGAFIHHASLLLEHLSAGTEPSAEELEALGELGARRSAQGVPLPVLTHAYQIATRLVVGELQRALWRRCESETALLRDLVPRVTERAVSLSGRAGAAVFARYLEATQSPEASLDALVGDKIDADLLRRRLNELGFVAAAAHVVFVIAIRGGQQTYPATLLAAGGRLRSGLRLPPEHLLIRPRGQELVVVAGLADATSFSTLLGSVDAMLADLAGSCDGELVAGVGGPVAGAAGIAVAYQRARFALDVRRRIDHPTPTLRVEAALPYAILDACPTLSAMCIDLVEPLLDEAGSEEDADLARCLEVYLAAAGVKQDAALALNMHRRTLDRRLDRITEVTGWDLKRDGAIRAALDLGLRGLRLRGQ